MVADTITLDDGREIRVDEKGYLLDPGQWDADVAEHIAGIEGFALTAEHFEVFELFRAYFDTYEIEPPMRVLVKLVAASLGEDKGNSRYLYRLFPEGPTTQASRYAGLPRPLSCI